MNNTNSTKGSAGVVIAVIAAAALAAGVAYYFLSIVPKNTHTGGMMGSSEHGMGMMGGDMMGPGVVLTGGAISLEEGKTVTPITGGYTFVSGITVSAGGLVTKKDGTTVQLKEGESVWEDGTVMKAGEMMEGMEGDMMMGGMTGKEHAPASSAAQHSELTYYTMLIWYQDGKTDADFLAYQRKIGPVVEKYDMKLLKVIKPSAVMGKDVPFTKPDRIEIAAASDPTAMGRMQQDPEMTQYQELRAATIKNVMMFPGALVGGE